MGMLARVNFLPAAPQAENQVLPGAGCISHSWVPLLILLLILILISSPSCIRIQSKIKITIKKDNPKKGNAPPGAYLNPSSRPPWKVAKASAHASTPI